MCSTESVAQRGKTRNGAGMFVGRQAGRNGAATMVHLPGKPGAHATPSLQLPAGPRMVEDESVIWCRARPVGWSCATAIQRWCWQVRAARLTGQGSRTIGALDGCADGRIGMLMTACHRRPPSWRPMERGKANRIACWEARPGTWPGRRVGCVHYHLISAGAGPKAIRARTQHHAGNDTRVAWAPARAAEPG